MKYQKIMKKNIKAQILTALTAEQVPDQMILTHDGIFHGDDVLGCFFAMTLPENKARTIKRTRDVSQATEFDILMDVGGVDDAKKNRYDHHFRGHQRTFSSDSKFLLSSSGLFYLEHGKRILESILTECAKHDKSVPAASAELIDFLFVRLYEKFNLAVDAADHGDFAKVSRDGQTVNIESDLYSRIRNLNNQPSFEKPDSPERAAKRFSKAVALAGDEFTRMAVLYAKRTGPELPEMQRAFDSRFSVHPSGQVVKLDFYVKAEDYIDYFDKKSDSPKVMYMLHAQNNEWKATCINRVGGNQSHYLLKAWRGKNAAELSQVSGIDNLVFCHPAGFIGSGRTYESALAMIAKTIDANGNSMQMEA